MGCPGPWASAAGSPARYRRAACGTAGSRCCSGQRTLGCVTVTQKCVGVTQKYVGVTQKYVGVAQKYVGVTQSCPLRVMPNAIPTQYVRMPAGVAVKGHAVGVIGRNDY